jgi:hypothetical protein
VVLEDVFIRGPIKVCKEALKVVQTFTWTEGKKEYVSLSLDFPGAFLREAIEGGGLIAPSWIKPQMLAPAILLIGPGCGKSEEKEIQESIKKLGGRIYIPDEDYVERVKVLMFPARGVPTTAQGTAQPATQSALSSWQTTRASGGGSGSSSSSSSSYNVPQGFQTYARGSSAKAKVPPAVPRQQQPQKKTLTTLSGASSSSAPQRQPPLPPNASVIFHLPLR